MKDAPDCLNMTNRTGIACPAIISRNKNWSGQPRLIRSNGIRKASGFFAFEHLHRLAWHDRRNRMLVDKLRMTVTTQKHAEIIEGRHNAGQFHAIDKENRQRNLLLAYRVQKKVL
jgi:hypothetical protein